MKNVWDILEQEPSSPSVPGSAENSGTINTSLQSVKSHVTKKRLSLVVMNRDERNDNKTVRKAVIGQKPHVQKSRVSVKIGSQLKPKARVPKIRNYNLKDGDNDTRQSDQRHL